MKTIVCEMCGSNEVVKQNGVYVCQHCNTKYTVEEAKKLLVTIDNTAKVNNLLTVAKNAQQNGNYLQAGKYYDLALQENPNNWEAAFYSVYDVAMESRLIELENAAFSILSVIPRALELIKCNNNEPVDDESKLPLYQQVSVMTIELEVKKAAQAFYDATCNHYNKFSDAKDALLEKKNRFAAIIQMVLGCGDHIYNYFGAEDFGQEYACLLWEFGLSVCPSNSLLKPQFYDEYVAKLQSFRPEYKPVVSTNSSGGCYIATSVYGSYDCPQVWTLRRFRDFSLAKSWYGRLFIKLYYAVSPTLVRWFGNMQWFKAFWLSHLDKLVINLQNNGFESTPYDD